MDQTGKIKTLENLLLTPKLLEENNLKKLHLTLAIPNKNLDPKMLNRSVSVREIIRLAALNEAGFERGNPARIEGRRTVKPGKGKGRGKIDIWKYLNGIIVGRDISNEVIFEGNIKKAPLVISKLLPKLLQKPKCRGHHQWQDVVYWNLGNIGRLFPRLNAMDYLLIPEPGVMLFLDELQRLKKGETITPLYIGELNEQGLGESKLISYAIRNGNLYKVWALALG